MALNYVNEIKTYAVYSVGDVIDHLLGYATGLKEDIEVYYDDRKGYGLRLVEIKPVTITSENATNIHNLRIEKARIEKELDEVNKKIKNA